MLVELNPLQTTLSERGTVSTRVAFVLRSAEVQPLFLDLCMFMHAYFLFLSFYRYHKISRVAKLGSSPSCGGGGFMRGVHKGKLEVVMIEMGCAGEGR